MGNATPSNPHPTQSEDSRNNANPSNLVPRASSRCYGSVDPSSSRPAQSSSSRNAANALNPSQRNPSSSGGNTRLFPTRWINSWNHGSTSTPPPIQPSSSRNGRLHSTVHPPQPTHSQHHRNASTPDPKCLAIPSAPTQVLRPQGPVTGPAKAQGRALENQAQAVVSTTISDPILVLQPMCSVDEHASSQVGSGVKDGQTATESASSNRQTPHARAFTFSTYEEFRGMSPAFIQREIEG